jgi:general secretion pathway protein K
MMAIPHDIKCRAQEKNSFKLNQSFTVHQNGSALIVVLLLVAILVALTVNFIYEVFIDISALSNWSNAQKASLIAKSGQTLSTQYLKEVRLNPYSDQHEIELPIDIGFGSNVNLLIKVEDENAKFNINSIISSNGLTEEKALASLKKLLDYLKLNPDLSLIIADWIDPDSEPRLSDSEDFSKNTFLWCVDELKLVEGVDKTVFKQIRPYITVHGNNLVNINTAELPVLFSLSKDMTEDLARRIIDFRESTPFEDTSSIVRVSGLESVGIRLLGRIAVKGTSFRITTWAKVNEITRVIESVMDTSMKIHFWREG